MGAGVVQLAAVLCTGDIAGGMMCRLICSRHSVVCATLLVCTAQATLCANFAVVLAAAPLQVLLYSSQPFGPSSMRELNSNRVSQLVQISGIITSASKPKVRLVLQLRLAFVVRHAVASAPDVDGHAAATTVLVVVWKGSASSCSGQAAVQTRAPPPAAGSLHAQSTRIIQATNRLNWLQLRHSQVCADHAALRVS